MIRIVIVEDEGHAAEKLKRLIEEIEPGSQVVEVIPTVKEAVRFFRRETVDLVFLDIQLLDGQSFEIFEQVEIHTPVIFTTAYNQYAIEAFKLNSVDYLLKPVRKDELKFSLEKYHQTQLGSSEKLREILEHVHKEQPAYKTRFLIQFGQKMKMILVSDIAYFFARDKAVYIRTFSGNDYPSDHTLEGLSKMVDPSLFRQVNRKIMVNIHSIENMFMLSRSRVKLQLKPPFENASDAIVSIERSKGFRQWIENSNA